MQIQRPVCLVAVQKDGDAGDGDVSERQCDQHDLPPGCFHQSIAHPMHGSIQEIHEMTLKKHALAT
jgi:hypothetical protein